MITPSLRLTAASLMGIVAGAACGSSRSSYSRTYRAPRSSYRAPRARSARAHAYRPARIRSSRPRAFTAGRSPQFRSYASPFPAGLPWQDPAQPDRGPRLHARHGLPARASWLRH